jgi:TubC N-terminal docking domain
MIPSPSAAELLVDLAENGMEVEALDDAVRYRPKAAMTLALLQRLKENKVELLRLLDTAAAMAAIRHSVERLWKDPAWQSAWERRFKAAHHANFASLRRMLDLALEHAEVHHRRHDWSAFVSTCRYLNRLASGEYWDEAERTVNDLRSDLTRWVIE